MKREGRMKVYRGKPEFWTVLDDSFEPKARRMMQEGIDDVKMVRTHSEDKALLQKKQRDMESDAEDDYVQLPVINRYIK